MGSKGHEKGCGIYVCGNGCGRGHGAEILRLELKRDLVSYLQTIIYLSDCFSI